MKELQKEIPDACEVQIAHVDELLVVTVHGIVTQGDVLDIWTSVRDALARRDARAVVIDATGAVVMIADLAWRSIMVRFVTVPRPMPHPIALIVNPRYERAVDVACDFMAEHGYVHMAFIDVGQALLWASRCLVHWRHDPWPVAARQPVVEAMPASQLSSRPLRSPEVPWLSLVGRSPDPGFRRAEAPHTARPLTATGQPDRATEPDSAEPLP
jgi:hypothetical protein